MKWRIADGAAARTCWWGYWLCTRNAVTLWIRRIHIGVSGWIITSLIRRSTIRRIKVNRLILRKLIHSSIKYYLRHLLLSNSTLNVIHCSKFCCNVTTKGITFIVGFSQNCQSFFYKVASCFALWRPPYWRLACCGWTCTAALLFGFIILQKRIYINISLYRSFIISTMHDSKNASYQDKQLKISIYEPIRPNLI